MPQPLILEKDIESQPQSLAVEVFVRGQKTSAKHILVGGSYPIKQILLILALGVNIPYRSLVIF